MANKPVIGITSSISDGVIKMRANYAEAILDAGGLPVFLPYTTDAGKIKNYALDFDGFMFAGGVDVDPVRYGEEKKFDSVEINEARDNFEFALFPEVLSTEKPILGICRGIQFINVAMGGTLYQHIEGHNQTEGSGIFKRPVCIAANSRLRTLAGGTDEMFTNSYHHQAVKDAAPGLVVTAIASDGTTECLEKPDHPYFLAVQWHPEMFYRQSPCADAIFKSFVAACAQNK